MLKTNKGFALTGTIKEAFMSKMAKFAIIKLG